jgi:FG-GAP-like repeat
MEQNPFTEAGADFVANPEPRFVSKVVRSILALIIIGAGVVLGVPALGDSPSLWVQNDLENASFQSTEDTGVHEARVESMDAFQSLNASETTTAVEALSSAPSTRSSFMASWETAIGATGYFLDVSTSPSFDSYLDGYHDLDVGNVTGSVVTGLSPGTTYYYRMRAYDATEIGEYSGVGTGATVPATGLTIHATFDSSITGNPNAAAIEAMINRAISIYESLFSDPITVQIRFRYATTAPDGTPLPAGVAAMSLSSLYQGAWSTFINGLRADGKTSNDFYANLSLPRSALSADITVRSANGRAVGGNTPPDMFANGTRGPGGPYDGIVTLNSGLPFQFTRPTNTGHFDAQRFTQHEMDEVMGLGSRLGHPGNNLRPQDLFSWSSPHVRNITRSGTRYFSTNSGVTHIVNFNQTPNRDFGDWLSTSCPQAHPYVQNAAACSGQSSDVTHASPEGINLDVIGYDLVNAPAPVPTDFDFNNDEKPDYALYNPGTRQTTVWYMNNNFHVGTASGPTLPPNYIVAGVADFNRDGHVDALLFNPTTRQTVIGYLFGVTLLTSDYGPTLPSGWEVVATGDFNGNGHSDFVLHNPGTRQTKVWYMNDNVHVSSANGPTLPVGWSLVAVADFNGNGHPDYLLFNPGTGQTTIWYMNNNVHAGSANGPTLPVDWSLVGAADFNHSGRPDYLLYNSSNRQTMIWYMNNNVHVASANGPTLPVGRSLVAP